MAKVETINFRSFMRNENEVLPRVSAVKVAQVSAGLVAVMIPRTALAATSDAAFGTVWHTVMNIVDWIAVGVFTFSGVSWMLGHRGAAIERLIGGAAGYLLARHAIDIRNWLRGI